MNISTLLPALAIFVCYLSSIEASQPRRSKGVLCNKHIKNRRGSEFQPKDIHHRNKAQYEHQTQRSTVSSMNQEQADARLHPVVELAGIVTLLRAAGNNPGQ